MEESIFRYPIFNSANFFSPKIKNIDIESKIKPNNYLQYTTDLLPRNIIFKNPVTSSITFSTRETVLELP